MWFTIIVISVLFFLYKVISKYDFIEDNVPEKQKISNDEIEEFRKLLEERRKSHTRRLEYLKECETNPKASFINPRRAEERRAARQDAEIIEENKTPDHGH